MSDSHADVTGTPRPVRWKYELDALRPGTVITSIDRIHAHFLPEWPPVMRNYRKDSAGRWTETRTGLVKNSSEMRWEVLPGILVVTP